MMAVDFDWNQRADPGCRKAILDTLSRKDVGVTILAKSTLFLT